MSLRLLSAFFFYISLLSCSSPTSLCPEAEKGILDLRDLREMDKLIVKLNGEWEFYWNTILHPDDFEKVIKPKPDYYGTVPSYWTDYPDDSVRIQKTGFATYRLVILLPPGFRKTLALDMPVFDSSYDIYAYGRYLGGNGIPGRTEEESIPGYKRNFLSFVPESDSVPILINVSNFHHRRGGFWLPVRMGEFSRIKRKSSEAWAGEWATVSVIMGFSLFFLFFFLIYPKDKLMGFFSLATTALAIRPFFTSHFLILDIIDINWVWIVRLEYLGLYIILTGWFWYIANLYPGRFIRVTAWIITGLFFLKAILTVFLPVKIFSYSTYLTYPVMILLVCYAISQNIRGIIKKRPVDFVYFLAFLLLCIGVIHDLRVSLGKSDSSSGYILTYILVVFVFVQAALLLYKWVTAFYEKEKLHNDLEYLNRNLELLVSERTREIGSRQEEIENQSRRIALQNRQLSETLQLKNKIFSVIAHDLRSPVVNILYMLNLLKENENKEKYDLYANASIQYAQQVITLLENMLVWGRGQEDKIKSAPGRYDLADIILTNLSIFKEPADKKEISVNFTQIGKSIAFFDKDLLDIIIRNLLSNAVKYTPRGGRISIVLKDRTLSGEGIFVKVCDNGIGIPPVKQKYLFTLDEIESTPGTDNEKGTGIGLKLCYELIRLNNGTITVESTEGEGTCFTISLPE